MRTALIALGLLLLILGLGWPWIARLGLGHLPGDIRIQRPGLSFFFPLTSSVLVSVGLSLLLSLIFWLWRR
jgi:hypothetical protein